MRLGLVRQVHHHRQQRVQHRRRRGDDHALGDHAAGGTSGLMVLLLRRRKVGSGGWLFPPDTRQAIRQGIHHDYANQPPQHRVDAGDEVEAAEIFGVIEIVSQVRREMEPAAHRGQLEQSAHGIDPQASILIQARIEVAGGRVHLRQGPEGDHLIGLGRVEAVAQRDGRPLGIGAVEHDRLIAPGERITVHIGPGRIRFPSAGQSKQLRAGGRRLVAEQVGIDRPRGQPPVNAGEEDHRRKQQDQQQGNKRAQARHGVRVYPRNRNASARGAGIACISRRR